MVRPPSFTDTTRVRLQLLSWQDGASFATPLSRQLRSQDENRRRGQRCRARVVKDGKTLGDIRMSLYIAFGSSRKNWPELLCELDPLFLQYSAPGYYN